MTHLITLFRRLAFQTEVANRDRRGFPHERAPPLHTRGLVLLQYDATRWRMTSAHCCPRQVAVQRGRWAVRPLLYRWTLGGEARCSSEAFWGRPTPRRSPAGSLGVCPTAGWTRVLVSLGTPTR